MPQIMIDPTTGQPVVAQPQGQPALNPWVGLSQVTTKKQVKSPLIDTNTYENLLKRINERGMESIAAQKQGIDSQEATINDFGEGFQQKLNLSPLLALSDSWTGTKLAQGYQAPETADERKLMMAKLRGELQKSKQGLSDDELKLLKTQLDSKLAMSTMAGPKLLPGQESVDRAFGRDFQDYSYQGGYAGVEKNLAQLEAAKKDLQTDPSLSGGLSTMLPDALRARVDAKGYTTQQKVQETAVNTLKQILGSQFTENDRKIIMSMSYDANLPAEENQEKIDTAINYIRTRAKQKQESGDYFVRNRGTLQGYTATQPDLNDSKAPSGPPPPKPGEVVDGYVFQGGNPNDPAAWVKQ